MATRVRCGVLRDRGGFVIGRYRSVGSEGRSPRKTDDAAVILITDNTRHFARIARRWRRRIGRMRITGDAARCPGIPLAIPDPAIVRQVSVMEAFSA
jgi:hypothetical protein